MKAQNKMLPLYALFLLLTLATLTQADIFPECDGYEAGTFLASPTDCNKFIYCSDEDSQEGSCPEGLHFDTAEGTCSSPEEANCQVGLEPETTTIDITEATTAVTSSIATTTAPKDSSTTTTKSPTDDGITTTLASGSNSLATLSGVLTVVANSCPTVDRPNEVVMVSSLQSCSIYYLCLNGQAIELRCANHLHFNTKTGMCDYPENVGCSLERPNAEQCRPNMAEFFPHAANCNYFYYCIKGFLTLQQCPFFYGWDVERRACVQMSQAKCYQSGK